MPWEVRLRPKFLQQLGDLERAGRAGMRRRIERGLSALEEDPLRPRSGADIRPLEGQGGHTFRLRVGEYRIVYEVRPGVVLVTQLATREHVYR